MKGIVLAGGQGTRLKPLTISVSKQLLPIYDKPMIYYPISILMLANITEIMIITNHENLHQFQNLLGDGQDYGVRFSYATQPKPIGIAEAFLIAEEFIDGGPIALILGDNILFGEGLQNLMESSKKMEGATIFSYHVSNPNEFGVVERDENGMVLSIEEKPDSPKSSRAVVGLYYYDSTVVSKAKKLLPSCRGELEITALNNAYLEESKLNVTDLGRGIAWFDAGTHQSLMACSQFVYSLEQRQGLKIACLEEVAYNKGWINEVQMMKQAKKLTKSDYGAYIETLISKDYENR